MAAPGTPTVPATDDVVAPPSPPDDARIPDSKKMLVRWTILNHDLGKHHNEFIEQFPDCLFVRVITCGPDCSLKPMGAGGVALIKEDVMVANALHIVDDNGIATLDRDAPFLITEDDIIAFGQFGPTPGTSA